MKIFLSIILLLLAGTVSAQTLKTEAGKRLKEIEPLIVQSETQIKAKEVALKGLLAKYSSEYFEVKATEAEISKLNEILLSLQSEKKQLLAQKLIKDLPNNQIELLKLIIIQNEKIIELLEKSLKP